MDELSKAFRLKLASPLQLELKAGLSKEECMTISKAIKGSVVEMLHDGRRILYLPDTVRLRNTLSGDEWMMKTWCDTLKGERK